jgi:hypothetical protein
LGGLLVGFTINEAISDRTYIGHFGKFVPGVAGLHEAAELETARVMHAAGFEWLNLQEDMGEPTLRSSKRSWEPDCVVKKTFMHLNYHGCSGYTEKGRD